MKEEHGKQDIDDLPITAYVVLAMLLLALGVIISFSSYEEQRESDERNKQAVEQLRQHQHPL